MCTTKLLVIKFSIENQTQGGELQSLNKPDTHEFPRELWKHLMSPNNVQAEGDCITAVYNRICYGTNSQQNNNKLAVYHISWGFPLKLSNIFAVVSGTWGMISSDSSKFICKVRSWESGQDHKLLATIKMNKTGHEGWAGCHSKDSLARQGKEKQV